MPRSRDDILFQVRALKAKAEDLKKSSPEEADAFFRGVRDLQTKYKLTSEEIDAKEEGIEVGWLDLGNRPPKDWQNLLAAVVSYECFCRGGVFQSPGRWQVFFAGKKHDVAICEHMMEYAFRMVDRLAQAKREELQAAFNEYTVQPCLDWWIECYRLGATQNLANRFHERKLAREAQPEYASEQALVRIEGKEIEDWINENMGTDKISVSARNPAESISAGGSGYQDADSIPIQEALEEAPQGHRRLKGPQKFLKQ